MSEINYNVWWDFSYVLIFVETPMLHWQRDARRNEFIIGVERGLELTAAGGHTFFYASVAAQSSFS